MPEIMPNKTQFTRFQKQVYDATRKIPKGNITTYLSIAKAIDKPHAYRAVGNALNKNPFAPEVPCHRVVKSNGRIGGFAKSQKVKREMLESERICINNKGIIENFKKIQFHF